MNLIGLSISYIYYLTFSSDTLSVIMFMKTIWKTQKVPKAVTDTMAAVQRGHYSLGNTGRFKTNHMKSKDQCMLVTSSSLRPQGL